MEKEILLTLITELLKSDKKENINLDDFIGKKVIVRSYEEGVHFGTLKEKNGQEVILSNSRRIWYWSGAATLSQLAVDGAANKSDCKIACLLPTILILNVCSIIPCSEKAIDNIESMPEWKE